MAHPEALDTPLVDSSNITDHSWRRRRVISMALVAFSMAAIAIAALILIANFNTGGDTPVMLTNATEFYTPGLGCSSTFCKDNGFTEDECNCGVCGSFGECSWSCEPSVDKAKHHLMSCRPTVDYLKWTTRGLQVVIFLIVMVAIVLAGAIVCDVPCNFLRGEEKGT
mmetsp:Transcript_79089/g.144239  ORF Transcript_79089/g.144239 Transcript_79089/m.144239 type:complete len:167 (-) Transcript_79089:79-579(-)